MARLNDVKLIGYLTADPEIKQTTGGLSVTSFQIGVSRRRTASNPNPPSDFFTIVAWRGTAEFITKYFRKGDPILICGELKTRSWDDQNGNKRYATEVEANEASFVERRQGSGDVYAQSAYVQGQGQAATQFQAAPQFAMANDVPQFETIKNDEDLPF